VAQPNSTYAIHTESLCRDFGALRVVNDVSLAVPAGSVFGFLGPNGAGKTTTIRLLLGLLEPTSGRAEVLGFDSRTQGGEVRTRAGALLEFPGLYERLTAEDNLEFYGRVWRMPGPERAARIKELLTHLELWDRRKEIVGTWSRGMKQKLAVARAILHRPKVIFLDEPTAGLDPVAAAALREDLIGLVARESVTVFLTTHNLSEAERLCGLVGVIRQGRLLAVGPPDDLRAGSGRPQVEIEGSGFTEEAMEKLREQPEVAGLEVRDGRLQIELRDDASVAPLVRLLVYEGAAVEEVRKRRASLEEAFLSLMAEEPHD
jgi:ABC-2 type transport system ATP-binding protein